MITITLDIETIPDQRPGALASILADVSADFRAPSTLTKEQAAIDLGMTDKDEIKFTSKDAMLRRWEQEMAGVKSASVAEEKWRKTALSGSSGELIVIGYRIADGTTKTVQRNLDQPEADLISDFFTEIAPCVQSYDCRFIGHNIEAFDLRFLWQRAVINKIIPPVSLIASKYSDRLFDTMTAWAGFGNRISLDDLCRALDVKSPKGYLDGSKVWDYVKSGRVDEVAEYCRGDVDATYKCYRRMAFAGE